VLRIGEGLVHRAGAVLRHRLGEIGAANRPWISRVGASMGLVALAELLGGDAAGEGNATRAGAARESMSGVSVRFRSRGLRRRVRTPCASPRTRPATVGPRRAATRGSTGQLPATDRSVHHHERIKLDTGMLDRPIIKVGSPDPEEPLGLRRDSPRYLADRRAGPPSIWPPRPGTSPTPPLSSTRSSPRPPRPSSRRRNLAMRRSVIVTRSTLLPSRGMP
jgi:hypothetical protein